MTMLGRKYRKLKRRYKKITSWFTDDPVSSTRKTKPDTQHGSWDTQKLRNVGRYPPPAWTTDASGKDVYGPVRESNGWAFYDQGGNCVYTKQDRNKAALANDPISKPALTKKPGRPKLCGRTTADGTKCRRRGKCPHHKHLL